MLIQQTMQAAMNHHQAGRLTEAEALYRQVLRQDPDYADALNLLGLIAYQFGNDEVAVELIGRAIRIIDSVPGYHNNLGLVYRRLGRIDDAVVLFRKAIAIRADFPAAHCNLGDALQDRNSLQEAADCYRRALALKPDLPDVLFNLGNILSTLSKPEEAVACYRRTLALQSDHAGAHCNLGTALRKLGQWEDAIACYRNALALTPELAEGWSNLGSALGRQGHLDEAASCCRKALALNPRLVEAHYNLGNIQLSLGNPDDALACYQQVLALQPDYTDATRNSAFVLLYQSVTSAAGVCAAHRHYAGCIETPLKDYWPAHTNVRDAERRLKVGYVSPDFCFHSVAFFIEPVLAHHDRIRFEIYAYHNNRLHDAVTEGLRSQVDHWTPCHDLSDEQLAARIRADGIDILIDLAGHTQGNRLLTFARKPAPVQITYLGYPASTGLSSMDYRLTTLEVDPPGSEAWYSETLVRLPHTLWCYRPPLEVPPVSVLPAARNGFVTFGSTNKLAKLSDETVALWARILRAVPGSRLLLTHVPAGTARDRLQARFAAQGIDADRLILHDKLPPAEFRALAGEIDIVLDPFPYNGTTTTCEALWMGIPVISLIGDSAVARSGYALLKSVELAELAAVDEAGYVRIAGDLAGDLSRLDALRRGLRARMAASPLRDEAGLARDLEGAYRTVWREWCRLTLPREAASHE